MSKQKRESEFGLRVRAKRNETGVDQAALLRQLKISQDITFISKIENGCIFPNKMFPALKRLLAFAGVSEEEYYRMRDAWSVSKPKEDFGGEKFDLNADNLELLSEVRKLIGGMNTSIAREILALRHELESK